MELIVIILILLLIFSIIKNKKLINLNNEEIKIEEENLPYIKKNLMTKNEWSFYKDLKPIADKMNLSIIAKIRLADLVEIKKGLNKSDWQRAFNKINKKHIDFALCNPENLFPLVLIELDDSSHNNEKAQKNDNVKNMILEKTGYKLLRVKNSYQIEEKIENLIK